MNHNAACQKEGVTEGFPDYTVCVCACVCSSDIATLALHRQTQPFATTFHVTCTHGPLRAKTFLEHPHIHTCFLSPAESAGTTLSLWRHRKAELHVSFSYRGNPQHRLPLFTLICSRFTRSLFLLFALGGKARVFLRYALKRGAVEEDSSYKHSLSTEMPGSSYNSSQLLYVWNRLHYTG